MDYKEFAHLNIKKDEKNPFSTLFEYKNGCSFYIEPAFYTQFLGMKERHPLKVRLILDEMERVVLKLGKVIFTANEESPLTNNDEYMIYEINDITDVLGIYVEDKSRGSDYGD